MLRVRVNLTGPAMGEGVATHLFGSDELVSGPQAAADAAWGLWSLLVQQMPVGVSAQVDSVVEHVDEDTGQVANEITVTPGAVLNGTTGGSFAAGVGGRIRWRTNGFRNGRRVIGTTFVVPLLASKFEDNGTIIATTITALNTAASTFLADATADSVPAVIWSRPSAVGAADGAIHPIASQVIPDQVAWLTSRRH